MRRALPLSVQLLLILVGLLAGLAAVLTTAAQRSLVANLAADATRHVSLAARSREQTVSQLFHLRQKRAEGFLASLEALCTEVAGSGRLVWGGNCVRPMLDDFRKTERALGAVLTDRGRVVRRSGTRVSGEVPDETMLARVVRTGKTHVEYVMRARRGNAALTLQYDHEDVAELFNDPPALGRSAEVFLIDATGHFLTPVADGFSRPEQIAAMLEQCRAGADGFVGADYRGVRSFQSFRPLTAIGSACVGAKLPYDEAVAPGERMRADLFRHAALFVAVGIVLSLVAAHWVAAPVRHLAISARHIQTGEFERPISVGGPSEVRALGLAFNSMANNLAELVAREQAARREAEDANRSKDAFLATVSHELRTPLTAVMGWAHMLRTRNLAPDEMRRGLEVIERAGHAQTRLIDDLLDVSRIVSDRFRMAREPVSLTEVIDGAVDTLRPQADEKQLEVTVDVEPSVIVLGDARRLEQVVSNLLWNAVKFTERPGSIRITVRRVDREAVLTVSDTGVGISSAFLPHVFDWFRQADARSQSQSGLGLGLGIVRHIVQLHGGNVRAESRGAGQGATFTVMLPIHEPAALGVMPVRSTPPPPPGPTGHRLDRTRILLVEDDGASRDLVRIALERAGASVQTVASAADARAEVMAEPPDVLVSDIHLPAEDGYSLIRSLRSAGIETPAIAMAPFAKREEADAARAAGYQVQMAKPLDTARLVEAIETLLKNDVVH